MTIRVRSKALIVLLGLAMVGFTLSTASASTVLLTDDTGYSGPVLDLSAYANGSYNFTLGPVALPGGITHLLGREQMGLSSGRENMGF